MLVLVLVLVATLQAALANSTVSGVGITMEGIWTNYPMFEITLQQAFAPAPAPASAAAATSSSATATSSSGACDWGVRHPQSYLADYPISLNGGGAQPPSAWPYDASELAAAQTWCCAHDDCGAWRPFSLRGPALRRTQRFASFVGHARMVPLRTILCESEQGLAL